MKTVKSLVWVVMGILLGLVIGLPSGYLSVQSNLQNVNSVLQGRVLDLESQTAGLQSQMSSLQGQKVNLQRENADLQKANVDLQGNNSALRNENAKIQDQIIQLEQPRLVTRLGVRDCNWDYSSMRLYIQGEVWNAGAVTAEHCSLHVTLYRGSSVAEDKYVQLGLIASGSYIDISENVHYSGSALTNWTIIPEYDS